MKFFKKFKLKKIPKEKDLEMERRTIEKDKPEEEIKETTPEEQIKDFSYDELKISIEKKDSKIYLVWTGKCRSQNPGLELDPYLEELANKLKGYEIVCDFIGMEIMISSIIPSILVFAQKLKANGIHTVFNYNENLDWQEATFYVLAKLLDGMENIIVKGK